DARADYASTDDDSEKKEFRASTRWAWISLLVEIKTALDKCAFTFDNKGGYNLKKSDKAKGETNPRPFIRSGTGANDSLGQMAEYVSKLFRRQHRLHLFTLFIFKGQARVIRWDRAGAIISTPIDFEKDPSLLHQVLWRYACMNEVERGFDPTVVRATVEEIEAMRTCPAPNGWADKCRQDALGQPGWPVYKIMMRPDDLINQQGIQPLTKFMKPDPVDSIAPGGEVSYIIGKRYFATNSPSGRGTRGYIAYDVSRNRLVFLKDYWRSRLDSSIPEGEALKRLRASGVRNVPTPLAAGVVRDDAGVTQKTCTQEWLRDERTKCYSPIQEHYRLVVKEIGEPLTEEVKSVWELVKVICDALYVHRQAWEVEKILHRDISSMNILVYRYIDHKGQPRVVGLLIDWDLCKLTEYLGIASRPARSGTWQSMSARLLQRPGKKHEVADDIESFIHVFNWTCLRFVEHNLTGKPRLLQMHVVHMYEEQDIMVDGEKNEEEVGGEAKGIQMLSGRPAVKLTKPRTPLGKLLKELASICRQHYLAVEPESELVSQAVPLDSGPDEDESLDEMELFEDPLESDSEEERPETPSDTASETLSKHKKVYNAFRRALDKPKVEWNSVAATPDQFNDPVFKNSIVFQRRTERSSQRSSGSKRRLDGESADMTKLGPSKRMRSATVTGLESLEEEGFVAPHDEAQEQTSSIGPVILDERETHCSLQRKHEDTYKLGKISISMSKDNANPRKSRSEHSPLNITQTALLSRKCPTECSTAYVLTVSAVKTPVARRLQRPLRATTPPNTQPPDRTKIESTPVHASSSNKTHTAKAVYGKNSLAIHRPQYAKGMHPKISEMDFDGFLERFMPGPDMPAELATKIPVMDNTVLLGTKETIICDELCKVAQPILDHCPSGDKLVAKNTSHNPDNSDTGDYGEKLKVDVAFYPVDDDAQRDYTRPKLTTPRAATRWAWISLLVEIKTAHNNCALWFEDKKPFIRTGDSGGNALGQVGEYVAKLFRRQHRLHVFTLYVFKGQARVIRSDRAGFIVSTAIDFEKDPSLLHKIIWRYACLTQAQRGYDPSVVRATQEEINAMRSCPTSNDAVKTYRSAALDKPGWLVYKIKMRRKDLIDQQEMQPIADDFYEPDEPNAPNDAAATSNELCFIVGRHLSATDSPTGRGMRGYVAYDVSHRRLVFLKDYWRPRIESSPYEGKVLHSLRKGGVRYVPTPLAAGLVQDELGTGVQETCTQAFLPKDERTGCSSPIQEHYRLVIKEIGEPLDNHETPEQLVKVMWYALWAHRQAWLVEKLLHRDISAGNILIFRYIDKNGKVQVIGLLIDWDLCKYQKYLETVLRPARSGTWQFMSARQLRNPGKRHEVADDLEAFIHVLTWMCYRFIQHSLTDEPDAFKMEILHWYEAYGAKEGDANGQAIGGQRKEVGMLSGMPAVRVDPYTPLGELLKTLALLCQQHYHVFEPKIASTSAPTGHLLVHDKSAELKDPFNDDEPSNRVPAAPVVEAFETLSQHAPVFKAFKNALLKPADQWAKVVHTADQFEKEVFKNSAVNQRSAARSSKRSSGSKRSLEGESVDSERPGPAKRARSTTTELQSLQEEREGEEL
ncbi:uncharacterized protein C8Q71DRAFT_710121, partial [Rhodofomes roseus]